MDRRFDHENDHGAPPRRPDDVPDDVVVVEARRDEEIRTPGVPLPNDERHTPDDAHRLDPEPHGAGTPGERAGGRDVLAEEPVELPGDTPGEVREEVGSGADSGADPAHAVPQATPAGHPADGEAPGETTGEADDLFERDTEAVRQRWHEVQAGFVDDPRSAVERADGLVGEVVHDVTAALTTRTQKLQDGWKSASDNDTERLRLALREYRTVLERLLDLSTPHHGTPHNGTR